MSLLKALCKKKPPENENLIFRRFWKFAKQLGVLKGICVASDER